MVSNPRSRPEQHLGSSCVAHRRRQRSATTMHTALPLDRFGDTRAIALPPLASSPLRVLTVSRELGLQASSPSLALLVWGDKYAPHHQSDPRSLRSGLRFYDTPSFEDATSRSRSQGPACFSPYSLGQSVGILRRIEQPVAFTWTLTDVELVLTSTSFLTYTFGLRGLPYLLPAFSLFSSVALALD